MRRDGKPTDIEVGKDLSREPWAQEGLRLAWKHAWQVQDGSAGRAVQAQRGFNPSDTSVSLQMLSCLAPGSVISLLSLKGNGWQAGWTPASSDPVMKHFLLLTTSAIASF